MKLRTTHNSIRIRIRKSELAQLDQQGMVSESITFPTGLVFCYKLAITKQDTDVVATLADHVLTITLGQAIATAWINSNQVGIEKYLQLPDQATLHLLIEKDFPCLDREEEDKADTFWELAPEIPDAC